MRALIVASVAVALAGCGTTPMSDSDGDAAGKRFEPAAGRGVVYVYRPARLWGDGVALNVAFDGRMVASLAPDTWLRLEAEPGDHDLRCMAENASGGRVALKSGDVRFYSAGATLGGGGPRCSLSEVDAASGRQSVLRSRRVLEAIR